MTEECLVRPYPFGNGKALELHDAYPALQEGPPIRIRMPFGDDAWLVTQYAHVRAVLGDSRFSRAATVGKDIPRLREKEKLANDQAELLINKDGADHSRLRRVVAKEFSAARMRAMRGRIEEMVDQLLEDMIQQGPPVDLVEALAWPLAIPLICEILGVPAADHAKFRAWSNVLVQPGSGPPFEEFLEAAAGVYSYMAELIKEARRTKEPSLLGRFAAAQERGEITDAELHSLGAQILINGFATTVPQISNFTYVLLTHPRQLRELRTMTEPARWNAALEELLRYVPLLGEGNGFVRYLIDDVELGGVLMHKGDAVVLSRMAANRDESVFPNADVLDFDRKPVPNLAFGHGIHYCAAASLARIELEVCLRKLLDTFPGLRLAVPEEKVEWLVDPIVRGPASLPIAW